MHIGTRRVKSKRSKREEGGEYTNERINQKSIIIGFGPPSKVNEVQA